MAKRKAGNADEAAVEFQPGDLDVILRAWENYEGSVEVFESAAGAFLVGRLAGYDVLRIVHSWRTLRKYEAVLGIGFKESLPARTADSSRSKGIEYADKFRKFWKALAAGVSSEPDAKLVTGHGTKS